jgi:DNA repair ATPase RecN
MKKIARIRKELFQTNLKLNELNKDLQHTVDQLNKTNKKLSDVNQELYESNEIKETYIGHFLDLCSTYINKLEKFQNTLNNKAVERKLDELFRMLKSHDMIDQELRELYKLFDNIFLHLYPNFVEEFNSLLLEEERFNLRQNELLNVELRIFALIRLGITDSSRIANFLHYSANTIYNYRTRVRNKAAVPRDQFESLVMKIGVIQKI